MKRQILKNSHLLKLLLLAFVSIFTTQKSFAQYYWQITTLDTLKGDGQYCQNATANPLTLRVLQCAGGGSKPHNSTNYTLKWFVNTTNSNIGGSLVSSTSENTAWAFADVKSFTPQTNTEGTFYYYCEFSNPSMTTCGFTTVLTSMTAKVVVSGGGFTQQPTSVILNSGGTATFKASVDPASNATLKWQSASNNLPWTDIADNSFYTGSSTDSLVVSNVSISNHNQKFRLNVTVKGCAENSNTVLIQITDTCLATKSISVTDTLVITANLTSTNDIALTTVKVYPNPTKDKVLIRFRDYTVWNGYVLNVFDVLGKNVFTENITLANAEIDLNTLGGKGVYFMKITDNSSNVVVTKSIILE